MTKVFIVVLNFNGGGEVVDCLESLVKEGKRLRWRGLKVLVVDNGSTDGSLVEIRKLVRKYHLTGKIKIIENKSNIGFAAGNNLGIKYALNQGAEAMMLLNQDTLVQKGFLKPLLENKAEIVAPVIKFKRDRKWAYDFGGKINWWLGRPVHLESESGGEIDYVSGCAMLAKKSVFEKIGLLSEAFFLYFEDVDFCLRARKAGFKIAVEPKSAVVHKLSKKKKKPLKQHFSLLKSNLIFINKHVPFYKKPIAYLYWWLLLFKTLLNQF